VAAVLPGGLGATPVSLRVSRAAHLSELEHEAAQLRGGAVEPPPPARRPDPRTACWSDVSCNNHKCNRCSCAPQRHACQCRASCYYTEKPGWRFASPDPVTGTIHLSYTTLADAQQVLAAGQNAATPSLRHARSAIARALVGFTDDVSLFAPCPRALHTHVPGLRHVPDMHRDSRAPHRDGRR
jgi:hypothetical protein